MVTTRTEHYIEKMLIDEALTQEDRIELLKIWEARMENKVFTSILSSNELVEMNHIINYIKQSIDRVNND